MNSTENEVRGIPVVVFDGAITSTPIRQDGKAFAFEVRFITQHPRLLALQTQKPPMHFHPHQTEYFRVLSGKLTVEVEGKERVLTPEAGEVSVKPWTHHRMFPTPDPKSEELLLLISASDTDRSYRMDQVFFENWYRYQDYVVSGENRISIIQVMATFDAGDSYLSFPSWIPGGKFLSRGLGVIVGRWLGAIMGYQPFYKEWTTDWPLAEKKMRQSFFQRRRGFRVPKH